MCVWPDGRCNTYEKAPSSHFLTMWLYVLPPHSPLRTLGHRGVSLTQAPCFSGQCRRQERAHPHGAMSKDISEADLAARYAAIAAALPAQQKNYADWIASGAIDVPALEAKAAALGLTLDVAGGQIAYADDFEVMPLCFDFVYCRHGKTTGNTEPRVYQGYVGEPSNALSEIGLKQAQDAADLFDGLKLDPDLIVFSPLSRASETGLAYVRRHPELEAKVEYWEDAAEMRFGKWDNKMVKDMEDDSICR